MIYLYGASGHGKNIIEIFELQQLAIAGLLDDGANENDFLGYPVSLPGNVSLGAENQLIISIGNNAIRKRLAESIFVTYTTAIHPSCVISKRCIISAGTVIMAGVVINCDAVIGDHVILNTSCSIDHDCVLGNYAHVSPNAALAGNVTVGEGAHIGIGASVIQGINIGKWATVGAGAVVISDVPDYAVVVGSPAKIIKYNHG
ncbi:MAG: acetyltransferase [Bacteroidota bacterium]